MSVDVFGRQLKKVKGAAPGPRGIGYSLTTDNQYDVENKRLCNVAVAQQLGDAVNLETLQNLVQSEVRSVYQVTSRLRTELDDAALKLKIHEDEISGKMKKIDLAIETLYQFMFANSHIEPENVNT